MSNTLNKTFEKRQSWQSRTRIMVLAVAATFAVCVAQVPVSASDPVSAEAAKEQKSSIDRKYRKVVKNGKEYFCRREAITGSRLQKAEICLTQEQMDDLREHGQEYLRSVQNPAQTPNVAPPGGAGT